MCKVLIEYIMHLLHIFMINVDNTFENLVRALV